MVICYSGKSAPSAQRIAGEDEDIEAVRDGYGDINWGRASAHTDLNPDISASTNKRVMREKFAEAGVPMPKLVDTTDIIHSLERGVPMKFIGRPDQHSKGRGFWLIDSYISLRKAMNGTRRKKPATHFMEFVEADHEYRVHVFNGRSIRISEKSYPSRETDRFWWRAIKPTSNVKHVRKAAKQAVKALGLDFGAVDVLATENKCWVLEVNAAPGIGGSLPKLYAETFKRWYEDE